MSRQRISRRVLRACISEARPPFAHEVEAVASSAWEEIFAWREPIPWSDVPIGSRGYRCSMAVAHEALGGKAQVIEALAA